MSALHGQGSFDARGTPDAHWRTHLQDRALPPLDLTAPPARAVVAAPHPDDEVLALGGLLCLLARAGTSVEVLAVTDGEASNPGGSVAPADLAGRRVAETHAALADLGLCAPGQQPPVHRLGLPDGGREALEQPVAAALADLRPGPGDWLLGPWARDGHPDHEAVGRACAGTAVRTGAVLLAYPVWAWHWAAPDDDVLPLDRARVVRLPRDVLAAKVRALGCFVTQVAALGPLPQDAPVLPPAVLQRFLRPYEVVFT